MTEQIPEQEMEFLKQTIDKIFNLNIMKNSRTRDLVDARLIYSKILRERGHTLKSIAVSLHKDHTTIIHYLSKVDFVMKQDRRLSERYMICKDVFLKDKPAIPEHFTYVDLRNKVISLNNEIEDLILDRERVLRIDQKYKRLKYIIDLINNRTPIGEESAIESKINKMFNGLNQKE